MRKLALLIAVAAALGIACGSASAQWRVGVYFGGPGWWGAPYGGYYPYGNYPHGYYPAYGYYPAPGYYPYAYYPYPRYYPYPAYPVYAAPPPMYVPRPPRAVAYSPPPQRRERFTLSAQELFAFDRDELHMPQPKLDDIASALNGNPQIRSVTITGYTDRLGSEEYNLGLSQRRANAVKSYLVGKGVAPERLTAVGKGEADPVVHCDNRDRAALIKCLEPNRRVVVEPITVERRIG